MMEAPPCNNLRAEPLEETGVNAQNKSRMPVTHARDAVKIRSLIYVEDHHCNHLAIILTLPKICEDATLYRVLHWVIKKRKLERAWKQGLTTAYLGQILQTFPAYLWCEII